MPRSVLTLIQTVTDCAMSQGCCLPDISVGFPRDYDPDSARRFHRIGEGGWPVSVHRFSGESLIAGMERHETDGVTVNVYCPEKMLPDCFRFRNRLGMDVVVEALKFYRERKRLHVGELLRYGRVCRVEPGFGN